MSPSVGVAKYGRRQAWASLGAGVDRFRCRYCHPPIPTSGEDRGGDDTFRGHGTDEEASVP